MTMSRGSVCCSSKNRAVYRPPVIKAKYSLAFLSTSGWCCSLNWRSDVIMIFFKSSSLSLLRCTLSNCCRSTSNKPSISSRVWPPDKLAISLLSSASRLFSSPSSSASSSTRSSILIICSSENIHPSSDGVCSISFIISSRSGYSLSRSS